ncbi:MAG: metal-dependent transcriptional regulator [Candidatus Humimicrobiaceae bacterium]
MKYANIWLTSGPSFIILFDIFFLISPKRRLKTNKSTEEFLEALYYLTREDKTASTTGISKRLKIKPASVTEMLIKLADSGYINYSPYQGATLTPKGLEIAQKMTRKHRLLECFLHDMLKVENDRVHDEACEMEHALSDRTARALCRVLRSPGICPDDNKVIPLCDFDFSSCEECGKLDGEIPEKASKRKANIVPIADLEENQEATVAFIRGDNKALRKLLGLGLTKGSKIRVIGISKGNGFIEVDVKGSRFTLEDEATADIFVEKPSPEQA